MALALLFEDDSVVILDAVTQYSKTKNSTLSTHPIDKSSVITDHVSKENPTFTFRAIVSSADFHSNLTRSPELLLENNVGSSYNTPVAEASISSTDSFFEGLLPSSVAQIFDAVTSDVSMDAFRGYSHVEARNRFNKAWEDSELITLLDYDYDFSTGRSVDVSQIEECILTNFEDVEDVDTGDSLQGNFTLQKVRFAYIQETDIAEQPDEDVEDGASPEDDEGDQSTTEGALTQDGRSPFFEGSPLEDAIGVIDSIFGGD